MRVTWIPSGWGEVSSSSFPDRITFHQVFQKICRKMWFKMDEFWLCFTTILRVMSILSYDFSFGPSIKSQALLIFVRQWLKIKDQYKPTSATRCGASSSPLPATMLLMPMPIARTTQRSKIRDPRSTIKDHLSGTARRRRCRSSRSRRPRQTCPRTTSSQSPMDDLKMGGYGRHYGLT